MRQFPAASFPHAAVERCTPAGALSSPACSPTTVRATAPAPIPPPLPATQYSPAFTRPYTPRSNGKAERLIQTALREWAYSRAYDNSQQRAVELPRWLHQYNWHRPHASLDHAPPISRSGLDPE